MRCSETTLHERRTSQSKANLYGVECSYFRTIRYAMFRLTSYSCNMYVLCVSCLFQSPLICSEVPTLSIIADSRYGGSLPSPLAVVVGAATVALVYDDEVEEVAGYCL